VVYHSHFLATGWGSRALTPIEVGAYFGLPLSGVPVDDPITNSQIILVLAHNQHAYPILKIAALSEFQPDTIWIGPSSWVGRPATGNDVDFSWLPSYPGHIGPSLYRNGNEQNDTFFNGLQNWQN
jgi:hypothetical protein